MPEARWFGVSSYDVVDYCGYTIGYPTLGEALDGTSGWVHARDHDHWFTIDLGTPYTIAQFAGRSDGYIDTALDWPCDPINIDIFVSEILGNWGSAVAFGIDTWQDTDSWQPVVPDFVKIGRYVKVMIYDTEDPDRWLVFGDIYFTPFKIFDILIAYILLPLEGTARGVAACAGEMSIRLPLVGTAQGEIEVEGRLVDAVVPLSTGIIHGESAAIGKITGIPVYLSTGIIHGASAAVGILEGVFTFLSTGIIHGESAGIGRLVGITIPLSTGIVHGESAGIGNLTGIVEPPEIEELRGVAAGTGVLSGRITVGFSVASSVKVKSGVGV